MPTDSQDEVVWPPPRPARGPILLRATSGLLLLPAWLLAVILLLTATTTAGRLMGLTFVLLGPAWDRATLTNAPATARQPAAAWLLGAFVSLLGALWLSPDGHPDDDAPLHHVWTEDRRFQRFMLSNLTPEVDQFSLGTTLVPWVDPYVDSPQARRLATVLQRVYHQQRADPQARALGSVMHLAYQELLGFGPGQGHLFQRTSGTSPRAVLLFIHGSAGPFRGYQHVLAPLADDGVDIVSPTFGFGNWHWPGGQEALEDALDWVSAQPRYAGVPVIVAGLSNGGYGVARITLARSQDLAAVALISPVLTASDASALAREVSPGLPVHIVHGATDRRIPQDWLEANAQVLERAGWPVHLTIVEDEDHFLLFSQPEPVLRVLRAAVADGIGRQQP